MDLKQLKLAGITLGVGVAVGYFLVPHKTKIEVKEVIKIQTQEVIKVKNNVVTHTVTVKVPGGTETTTTDSHDTGTVNVDVNSSTEIVKQKITTSNGVSLGVYALSDLKLSKPNYGLLVDIPIASKFSVFVTGDTKQQVAGGLRFQF
jgi:hypothetical protein